MPTEFETASVLPGEAVVPIPSGTLLLRKRESVQTILAGKLRGHPDEATVPTLFETYPVRLDEATALTLLETCLVRPDEATALTLVEWLQIP